MSFARVPLWVFDIEGLTASELRLAGILYGYASKKNYRAWPAVETLSKTMRLSRRTVGRIKMKLARKGVLCFRHDLLKGGVHSVWMAVDKPKDFRVDISGPEFSDYRLAKGGRDNKVSRGQNGGPRHLIVAGAATSWVSRGQPILSTKSTAKVMGFLANRVGEQTIRTDQQQMVRQTDDARSREEGHGNEPGKAESRMQDGAGDEGARRAPPAPPTGRRADAVPQVSLDDFAETKKKRKTKPMAEGTPGQRLLDAFCVAWKEKFGIPYMPSWGRDLKLAKEMSANYTLDLIPAMVRLYLADKDPFISKEGYPFSLFRHRVNNYGFQVRRQTKGRSGHVAETIPLGKRVFVEETEHAVTHRVFTENGWEFEVVKKEKPKPEPTIMSDEEEFD